MANAKKFAVDVNIAGALSVSGGIDFAKSQALNVVTQNLATAPSNPTEGLRYYDTVTKREYYWNGTEWYDGGAGTITAISIASANGVSGTSSGGATPALTISLGAITPTTVNGLTLSALSTGFSIAGGTTSKTLTVSGDATVSGTNTGDQNAAGISIADAGGIITATTVEGALQEIKTAVNLNTAKVTNATHTGDVTGATALTIANNAVTLAKMADMATASLLGRNTAGTGDPEVLAISTVKTMLGLGTAAYTPTTDYAAAVHASRHKSGGADAIKLNELAVPTADVAMNSHKITGLATPSSGTDAATKDYVDAARAGLSIKEPVRVATTANITLSGTQTIDGVAVVAGDRVLVKNQTTGTQNGIYVVAASTWSRAIDADSSADVVAGMAVWVNEGTANGDSRWVLTTNAPITLDTTSLTFTKDFQASDIIAGAGLTKSGNQLDAVGTANRITVNADSIDIASTYVGQTSITTLGTITTGVWNGSDIPVTAGGTGASDAATARTNLGLAIGTNVQAYSAALAAIAALAVTDGNIIVANGTTWVAESGATARTSLGLGSMATQNANAVAITGGTITGITDLAVADGGTGASTAAGAKTNLGFMTRYSANNLAASAGATTTYTHNLNTLDVVVQVYNIATGAEEEFDIARTGVNTITVAANAALTANTYRIVVIG